MVPCKLKKNPKQITLEPTAMLSLLPISDVYKPTLNIQKTNDDVSPPKVSSCSVTSVTEVNNVNVNLLISPLTTTKPCYNVFIDLLTLNVFVI